MQSPSTSKYRVASLLIMKFVDMSIRVTLAQFTGKYRLSDNFSIASRTWCRVRVYVLSGRRNLAILPFIDTPAIDTDTFKSSILPVVHVSPVSQFVPSIALLRRCGTAEISPFISFRFIQKFIVSYMLVL